MDIRTYRDLDVWIRSKALTLAVYEATSDFPREEVYGLVNQLRRAAVSIPSNIAEGCGRGTYRGTVSFIFIARGSLYEIETQLLIANELKYLDADKLRPILLEVDQCKKLLNGFIRYLESKAASNE